MEEVLRRAEDNLQRLTLTLHLLERKEGEAGDFVSDLRRKLHQSFSPGKYRSMECWRIVANSAAVGPNSTYRTLSRKFLIGIPFGR